MRIGMVVGKTAAGKYKVIGNIGDVAECKQKLYDMVNDGGSLGAGKAKQQFVELLLVDASRGIMKRRKFQA